MSAVVYLNGDFLPPSEAKISVFDRGFLFGDGVYEVIPAYGGRLFRLQEHLRRLEQSLAAIRLPNPSSGETGWTALLQQLVTANGGGDQGVYLQVTRGAALRQHAFPAETPPTVFAMTQPLMPVAADLLRTGIAAITVPDIRWSRCDIKAVTLLPNVLATQSAVDQGAAEAILIRNGAAAEGAASNIFVVQNGEVFTPPAGSAVLPGITRDLVLELCRAHGIPATEHSIAAEALYGADEIWITSSPREVLPVTRLNGIPIGGGRPGPLAGRVLQLYRDYKEAFRAGRVA